MLVNKYIIVLFLLVGISNLGNAQSNCVQNLRDARNAYDEGKLQDMPNLLSKCIDNGFTDEEKVEALRFLTLSYLFSEEQEKAEISFLRLLKINPEFQVNQETDPTELIILSENYDTDPKFFYGLKLGSSFNLIQITQYKPVFNLAGRGSYEPPIGFGAGLFFQYPINDDFTANAEVHYNYRGTVLIRPTVTAEGVSGAPQTISENQQWIEMPLLINYKIPLVNKFLLEATAGPSLHYLLSSYLSVEGGTETINNLDMLNFRNQFNVSGIIGLRGNFKQLGRNYITIEALYQYRFIEEVDFNSPGRSQLDLDLIPLSYAENQYKGHAFILRLGFRFPRFNPELIK